MAPGNYRLFSRGPEVSTEWVDFTVDSQTELHFAFDRQPGNEVSIDIELAPGTESPAVLQVKVWDSAANRLTSTTLFSNFNDSNKPVIEWSGRFQPGSYRLDVAHNGAPDAVRSLEFAVGESGSPLGSPLRIDLP